MRKTFTKINNQKHPDSNKYQFYIPNRIIPDEIDLELSKEIIDLYKQSKSNSTGEWKWIDNNKRNNYINFLQEGNIDKLADCLCNFYIDDCSYGLITPNNIDNVLCDIDTAKEFIPNFNINLVLKEKGSVGNPYGLLINDKILDTDSLRHYYYISNISISKNIVEIGGGYGNLAYLFNKIGVKKYINIDLMETLLISYYFLKKNKIDVKMIVDDMNVNSDGIYLIPSNLYKNINYENIDCVINFNSFSEMGKETIDDYLSFIQNNIKPDYIYHQNSNFNLFPNSERHIEVIGDDFNINYNLKYKFIVPFIGGGGRYRIYLYTKPVS